MVAGHSLAAYRVGQITGATPVFVAVSRQKHLFLAPIVAVGVAPVPAAPNICVFVNQITGVFIQQLTASRAAAGRTQYRSRASGLSLADIRQCCVVQGTGATGRSRIVAMRIKCTFMPVAFIAAIIASIGSLEPAAAQDNPIQGVWVDSSTGLTWTLKITVRT